MHPVSAVSFDLPVVATAVTDISADTHATALAA
jgi:hypothetical protein